MASMLVLGDDFDIPNDIPQRQLLRFLRAYLLDRSATEIGGKLIEQKGAREVI